MICAPSKEFLFTPLEIDVMVAALRRIIEDSEPCIGPADDVRMRVLRVLLGRFEEMR